MIAPADSIYPHPMHLTGLPIEAVIGDIRSALSSHRAAVVVAPPGSGKTTVVPIRLLDLVPEKILVLEPRRLATRAAARRMSSLLGESVGETVGYVTRHDRATSATTRIEVVTEGVLTRRLQSDPTLKGTSMVIFDEVHERNLQTDLGLALTLDIRSELRPDLMVMAMSATVAADRFSAILGDVPVVRAEGESHPVELIWDPAPPRSRHLSGHVAAVVRKALDAHPGDVLVFLAGMADIRRTEEALEGVLADVAILHGSAPPAEQDAALAPSSPPFRKVVLSTDIAESSLTVEGIGVVVDSGEARSPRYDPHTGMTRLQTISISRASADQRAGRAGRLGPGVAYRLWSKMEHAARQPHIEPEILEVDLSGLVLELATWGVSDPSELAWLDSPPTPAWAEAQQLLEKLGAIAGGAVTASGRQMANLPVHPRLARMITDSGDDSALAVWLAAIVSERDPVRGRPDKIPTGVGLRVRLLTDRSYHHPAASIGSLHRLRAVAEDLAGRSGVSLGAVDIDNAGRVLALAFPDRLAIRRGSPGRFQLRTGTTAFMDPSDPLAIEDFVVAADLDGRRKDARIRLAAGIDREDVIARFAPDESRRLVWEHDRLIDRTEKRLGGITLATLDRRPEPGAGTVAALLRRVKDRGVANLPWSKRAIALRHRVNSLSATSDSWPDWSDRALTRTLESWLAPYLSNATSWDDVERLDLTTMLNSHLTHEQHRALDRLAPAKLRLPSGREVEVDYEGDAPTVAVRVQDVFGLRRTPKVGGRPIRFELLSPANRPIQVTSDLEGFWSGSWHEVRKDMAGRYPKHDWPENP